VSTRSADVLVVGGGVIGVATAHACALRDLSVTLLERHGLAAAASGRNQGLMLDSHPPAMKRLAADSVERWLGLHERTGGAFLLDRSPRELLVTAADAEALEHDAAQSGAVRVGADELRTIEPLLSAELAGAVLVPGVRRVDPGAGVSALADEARRHGAVLQTGCAVKALRVEGGRVTGVLTERGELHAGTIVVAAGPWSWQVCRSLSYDVPVRGVRGWLAITRPAPFRLSHVVEESRRTWRERMADQRWTVADAATGVDPPRHLSLLIQQDDVGRVMLGSSLAASPGDRDEGEAALRELCARAVAMKPPLAQLEIAETRSCARPATPDGLPLHGPVPGVDGLVLATGHGGQGISWGLGAGEAIAEGIVTGRWDAALAPERAL
jgi:glycine/D-amino acid oxidase-like deaminating enzyme